jgi:hypothetical protein
MLRGIVATTILVGSWPIALGAQVFLGSEFQVNTYTTNSQTRPSLAGDAAGNFVVVWHSLLQDGNSFGVFGQRYSSSGAALGSEFQVNTQTSLAQRSPRVAAASGGSFVVVWESRQDFSTYGIWARRYNASGVAQATEFQVNTYTTGAQTRPWVAMSGSGAFVVVWTSFGEDGSDYGVWGRRFSALGVPQGVAFQVNVHTTGRQYLPVIAADPSGAFVVVWESPGQDGSGTGVFGRRYDAAGVSLGGEFQVNSYTTADQRAPVVAVATGGEFTVAWHTDTVDQNQQGVFAARYDASGIAQGAEFKVNTYTGGAKQYPAVAADVAGHFVVVWEDRDDPDRGIFGRRYAPSGTPVGGEFLISTYVTSGMFGPSVAADGSGRFVAAWSSAQDGSSYGVFGQRLAADVIFEDGFE